jgi:putative redox protein
MLVTVTFDGKLPLVGSNERKQKTRFDAMLDPSSPARHATPVEVLLQSVAACSLMDIIMILRKKKKEISSITTEVEALRAETHPRVLTSVRIAYFLKSPDCSDRDFRTAIELSIDTYCSVAAMIRNSGCEISWTASVSE